MSLSTTHPWPRLSDAAAHEIETFLDYDLVHHGVSAPQHEAHPDIHEWTMSAYAAMLELAREPRSSSALKTLDDIRDVFNRASGMFGRTVLDDELRRADLRRNTAKLAEERDHWSRQHDAARTELAKALQENERLSLKLMRELDRQATSLRLAPSRENCIALTNSHEVS
jgi:hypothetical protein